MNSVNSNSMHDYRGTLLREGDIVALYYGYGGLETGECMVKL